MPSQGTEALASDVFTSNPADVRRFGDVAEVARVGALVGVDPDSSDDELLERGVTEFNRAAWCLARSGFCFATLKERVGHGQFEQALAERGIAPRRAREAIQVAELVARLPEDQARSYASLPKSKALELAKADPEVIEQLLEDHDDLDDIGSLSVRELRQQIKDIKARKAHVDVDNERLRDQVEGLKDRLNTGHKVQGLPDFAAITRSEAVALTELMDNAVDQLEATAFEYILNVDLQASLADDQERYLHMAAGTLFHSLRGVVSRACLLMATVQGRYADAIGDEPTGEHLLLADEAQRYMDDRQLIVEQQANLAKSRANARENAKPGKRGRPRKVEG